MKRDQSRVSFRWKALMSFFWAWRIWDQRNGMNGATFVNSLTFRYVYIDNAQQDFESRGWLKPTSLFQRNLNVVGDLFCAYLDSPSNLELVIRVRADRNTKRAGATFNLGRYVGKSYSKEKIIDIWEPSPLTKIVTGSNPYYDHEIILYINAAYVEFNYWLDPSPGDRKDIPIPSRKTDFVSIIIHEIVHGLGLAGTIHKNPFDTTYGSYGIDFDYITTFDELSYFEGNAGPINNTDGSPNPMYFRGKISQKVNNGNLVTLANVLPSNRALFSQNFYHLGGCDSPNFIKDSAMNGCFAVQGPEYYTLTCIDLAVLADLGYPMKIDAFNNICAPSMAPSLAPIIIRPTKAPSLAPLTVLPSIVPSSESTTVPPPPITPSLEPVIALPSMYPSLVPVTALPTIALTTIATEPSISISPSSSSLRPSHIYYDSTDTANITCFPGNAKALVEGVGWTIMSELKLGDTVLTKGGTYDTIYFFGHRSTNQLGEFKQIHWKSSSLEEGILELSKDHMVLVTITATSKSSYRNVWLPSSRLSIGDMLVVGEVGSNNTNDRPVVITNIQSVIRQGLYAPFTTSGIIVVDNIVASNYVTLQPNHPYVTIFQQTELSFLSFHWLSHIYQSYYRLLFRLGLLVTQEQGEQYYNQDGIPKQLELSYNIISAIFQRREDFSRFESTMILIYLLIFLCIFVPIAMLEKVLNPDNTVTPLLFIMLLLHFRRRGILQ